MKTIFTWNVLQKDHNICELRWEIECVQIHNTSSHHIIRIHHFQSCDEQLKNLFTRKEFRMKQNNINIGKPLPTPQEAEEGADSVLYLRVLAFGRSRSLSAGVT